MSQELFEKYLRDELSDDEARELLRILGAEPGARAFVDFLQEWTVTADLARQLAAAGREAGVQAARHAAVRLRQRETSGPARPAWGWWAIGVAATALFMVTLALALRPGPSPEAPVVRRQGPEPVPEPVLPPLPLSERPLPAPPPLPPPVPEDPPQSPPTPPAAPETPRPEAPKPPPPAPPPVPVPDPPPAPKPTLVALAEVERVLGEVVLQASQESVRARAGLAVHAGDGLETRGRASAATVKYVEGTRIDLGPETKVEAFLERSGKRVLVASGTLTAQVQPQPRGRPMVLATPHAEITVLGTQFAVTVEAEGTRVDVLEGRVRFTRSADQRSMEVPAGRSVTAGKGIPWEAKPLVLSRDFQDGLAPLAAYSGTRDTSLSEVEPDAVFGAQDSLEVDGDETDGKSMWGLLSWDVSSIPPASVVRSAVISLHVTGTSQSAGYSIFEMRRPWAEGEASWRLFRKGQTWAQPGAKARADRGAEPLAVFSPRDRGLTTVLLNDAGVALVQAWIRNPGANHGLIIGRDASTDGFKFESRESKAPPRRPKLTVTYSPGK